MRDIAAATLEHLKPLVGLKLSASHRAADMRVFHFGTLQSDDENSAGNYSLHVQCPWRIQTLDRIITGRHDLFKPAKETEDFDWDTWDWDGNETLQDRLVADFIATISPVVEDVLTDPHGGATLILSDRFCLVLFPADSHGEDWRVFRTECDDEHFVVSGGRVEEGE